MITTQRTLSLLVCVFLVYILQSPCLFAQQDLTGSWKGDLDVGLQKLPLIFHFQPDGDGWKATMDSPSQQAYGEIEETFSTEVMEDIAVWINELD